MKGGCGSRCCGGCSGRLELSEDEGTAGRSDRSLTGAFVRLGDPGGEGGVFDPALLSKSVTTHPAFPVSGEDFGFILRAVLGATNAVTLD